MPGRQQLVVPFPLGGVDKSRAYQQQPPHTTPEAINVRPEGRTGGRFRGGSRPGLTKLFAEQASDGPIHMAVVVEQATDVDATPFRSLVAVADKNLYASDSGSLIPISGALLTESGDPLLTESGEQILGSGGAMAQSEEIVGTAIRSDVLIADYGADRVSGDDGKVDNSNELTATGVSDWTSYGIDKTGDVVVITAATGSSVETGTYAIAEVQSGKIVLGATLTTGECSYQIAPGPKIYHPDALSSEPLVATSGQAPLGAQAVATYRDRAVWVKDRVWFMSRQGDYLDYDYSQDATDAGRAVAGTTAEAGQPGATIIALIPFGDDYLVMLGEDSTWVMRGDPAYGGQIDNLSRIVGTVGRFSWCYGASGDLYFLARDGIYFLTPGASSVPQPLSRTKLPRELINVDSSTNYVTMAFGTEDQGIHVSVTKKPGESGDSAHWFMDLETQSFYSVEYGATTMEPSFLVPFAEERGDRRSVVLASKDGFLRSMDRTASTDDSTAISSSVVLGPFRIGGDSGLDGVLAALFGTLDTASGSVTVEVYSGDDGEEAADNATGVVTANHSVTWNGGRNTRTHPRVRGGAICLKLSSSSTWAMEQAVMLVSGAGVQRI